MPIQFQQQFYKSSFWLTIEESKQVQNPAGVDEGRRVDRCFSLSFSEFLFCKLHDIELVTSEAPSNQSWCNVFKLSTTQKDVHQRVLYPLKLGDIRIQHSREKSVAVVQAGTNHTASDSLGNFIRQRLPDMPQCLDVVKARSASIVHVLVE